MLRLVQKAPTNPEVEDWNPNENGGRTKEQVEANIQEAVLLVRVAIGSAIVGGVGWALWKFGNFLISFGSGF